MITETNVTKAIIVDPYFSTEALSNYLPRFQKYVNLEIITSLTGVDPDNKKPVEKQSNKTLSLLKKIKGLLNGKLKFYNITRGNNQAFHDRFLLLEYNDDKNIEVYHMGNSLNSAGISYPFIITPLEDKVALNVCEYINNLKDPEHQKELPKKLRNNIEILFDSVKEKEKESLRQGKKSYTYKFPTIIAKNDNYNQAVAKCIEDGYILADENARIAIVENKVKDLITELLESGRLDSDRTIALGEIILLSNKAYSEVQESVMFSSKKREALIKNIDLLSKEIERKYYQSQIYKIDERLGYSNMLRNKNTECNARALLNHIRPVFYNDDYYLERLYRLYFYMDPLSYVETMGNTYSPLMLSILLEKMARGQWNEKLYYFLLRQKWNWSNDLVAEWAYHKILTDEIDLKKLLLRLNEEERVDQCLYLISSMHNENLLSDEKTKILEKSYPIVFFEFVKLINKKPSLFLETKTIDKIRINRKLQDAIVKLQLAEAIENLECKDIIKENVLGRFEEEVKQAIYVNEDYFDLIIYFIMEYYSNEIEEIIYKKVLKPIWSDIQKYCEPYFNNYDNARNKVEINYQIITAKYILEVLVNKGFKLERKLSYFYELVKDIERIGHDNT